MTQDTEESFVDQLQKRTGENEERNKLSDDIRQCSKISRFKSKLSSSLSKHTIQCLHSYIIIMLIFISLFQLV